VTRRRYAMTMRYAVIMAGGSGKRLWPLSRQGWPKQLLPLFDGRSLLQLAFDRAARVVPPERIWVCTGAAYGEDVLAQLPDLPAANLLGEPEGRDSLNAALWPAAVLAARDDAAVMAVLTADHLITPEEVFADRLDEAFRLAEADAGALVTFGVVPQGPNTGYGYLERGAELPGFADAARVVAFTEKPDRATAEVYLATGRYWWNSGMFVWQAQTLLRQVALLAADAHAGVCALAATPDRLAEIYPRLPKISIDYGVMEPVSRGAGDAHVVAIGLPVDWRDVGSYESLADALGPDESGNATQGAVVAHDAADNLVLNTEDGTVVAVLGVRDLAVVRTGRATLVMPLHRSQDVRDLADRVAASFGDELA